MPFNADDGATTCLASPCEDSWMELGVGMAVDGAGADTGSSLSGRTVRSVLVCRDNVFKVEPRSGMEQLTNALKHL